MVDESRLINTGVPAVSSSASAGGYATPGIPAPITDVDKLKCVEREVAMRKGVYPKWIAAGKLTRAKADREIAVMEAIAAEYRQRMISGA
jgi:hypothetical protein